MDKRNWEDFKESFGINAEIPSTSTNTRALHSRHNTSISRRRYTQQQSQSSQYMKPSLAISVKKVNCPNDITIQSQKNNKANQSEQGNDDDWKWYGEDNEDYLNELVSVTSQYDAVVISAPAKEATSGLGNKDVPNKPSTVASCEILLSSPENTDGIEQQAVTENFNMAQRRKSLAAVQENATQSQIATSKKRRTNKTKVESYEKMQVDSSPKAKHSRLDSSNLQTFKVNNDITGSSIKSSGHLSGMSSDDKVTEYIGVFNALGNLLL